VGLHFSLEDLLAVRKIAVPGALAQIAVATAMGMGVATWWGWDFKSAFVFGLSLSCASTVVLLKALESKGIVDTMNGRIAIGWLIVEDLAMVLVLVLMPALAGIHDGDNTAAFGGLWLSLGRTLLEVGAFVAIMLVVGRGFLPWLLWRVTRTGSRELFTLCVVTAAVSIAYGATALFGVSFALGAFFAGMVLRGSEFSHRAAEDTLPLRDAFSVLFFVSVGMLFDPRVVIDHPFQVLAVIGIVVIGKSLAAAVMVLIFRYPLNTALTISASLAQIGEFSFILAALGVSLKLLPPQGQSLIVAGALISIALNPLVFSLLDPALKWIRARSAMARRLDERDDPLAALPASTEEKYLARQVVLVGYGRVGRRIADALGERKIPFVVAEQNRERVERLRAKGIPAVSGDATEPAVLVQAHIAKANMLVIATPDTVGVRQMIKTARALNPAIAIVVRMHSEAEGKALERDGLAKVFLGENELAQAMIRHVLSAKMEHQTI
jgi:CPA2 family monovalent cation:H+ antiporter-2